MPLAVLGSRQLAARAGGRGAAGLPQPWMLPRRRADGVARHSREHAGFPRAPLQAHEFRRDGYCCWSIDASSDDPESFGTHRVPLAVTSAAGRCPSVTMATWVGRQPLVDQPIK